MGNEIQVRVGLRIARARKEVGLTQKQLALTVGRAARTVQTWEAGERHPRTEPLAKIADATGRPVAWFYEQDEQDELEAAA